MRSLRVAIYGHISTADGRQDTDNQLTELRQFTVAQGWEIAGEYVGDESGGEADRVVFRRLFKDAVQGHFDVVLFWVLDQFTVEGSAKALQFLNELSVYGVGFRSFTEPWLDSFSLSQEAIIAILRSLEKRERAHISERVQAGLHQAGTKRTKSGRRVGRPTVVLDRGKAMKLRQQGLSWREIAGKLGAGATTVRRACNVTAPCQNPKEVGQ